MELCGIWVWSQCCSCAVVPVSLETVALEVDAFGSRRQQGEEHCGQRQICREGLEVVQKLCPMYLGLRGAGRATGVARAGLALKKERGILCMFGVGEGEKKFLWLCSLGGEQQK